jgi:hypothetical protein
MSLNVSGAVNSEAALPATYPREGGSPVYGLPVESAGPANFYPPVCLKTHWDPTMILARTLPEQYVPQPLDFRPWTRICMEYTTAGPTERAPAVPASVAMPQGGQFYPPGRYAAAIDNESQLRRLDRPLGTCEEDQWIAPASSDMYVDKALVPRQTNWGVSARVQELAYPKALLRNGPYDCRAAADAMNVQLASEFTFNNATKQDRYKAMKKDGARPAGPTAPLQAGAAAAMSPAKLRPDLTFNASRPAWQGPQAQRTPEKGGYDARTYERGAATARADLVANATTPAQQRAAAETAKEAAAGTLGVAGPKVGWMPSYAFPSQTA